MELSCCGPGAPPTLDEHGAEELAALFKVLSDPIRLRLVSLVAAQPDQEVCACDLVDVLDRSQPTISHHLKLLFDAGVFDKERRGSWIHYRLRPEVADQLHHAVGAVTGEQLTTNA